MMKNKMNDFLKIFKDFWCGVRDSDPWLSTCKDDTLPTELTPHIK